jgi:hypothetical protein
MEASQQVDAGFERGNGRAHAGRHPVFQKRSFLHTSVLGHRTP